MTSDKDSLRRFIFEDLGVRGEIVHLDASYQAVIELRDYPSAVRERLGEALAAVLLLSATIKLDGSLILQVQGEGLLRTLVAQATHKRTLRGLARWSGEPEGNDLGALVGAGRLVLTLEPSRGEPYQGVVPLGERTLAEALEHYFAQSEQLPTRLWLAADAQRSAGLLLQRLPGRNHERSDEDWARIGHLAATLSDEELLGVDTKDLLFRLFHEEKVRLLDAEPVAFRCTCSRERFGSRLRALGRAEIESLIAERGGVEVTCDFCGRQYHYDPVDAMALVADSPSATAPAGRSH